jgi:hypothetical protein
MTGDATASGKGMRRIKSVLLCGMALQAGTVFRRENRWTAQEQNDKQTGRER